MLKEYTNCGGILIITGRLVALIQHDYIETTNLPIRIRILPQCFHVEHMRGDSRSEFIDIL